MKNSELNQHSFPWTVNTNAGKKPLDRRGFYEVASYATNYFNPNQKMFTKTISSRNADNYAWMGASILVCT